MREDQESEEAECVERREQVRGQCEIPPSPQTCRRVHDRNNSACPRQDFRGRRGLARSLHNAMQEQDVWSSKKQPDVKGGDGGVVLTSLLLPQPPPLKIILKSLE